MTMEEVVHGLNGEIVTNNLRNRLNNYKIFFHLFFKFDCFLCDIIITIYSTYKIPTVSDIPQVMV